MQMTINLCSSSAPGGQAGSAEPAKPVPIGSELLFASILDDMAAELPRPEHAAPGGEGNSADATADPAPDSDAAPEAATPPAPDDPSPPGGGETAPPVAAEPLPPNRSADAARPDLAAPPAATESARPPVAAAATASPAPPPVAADIADPRQFQRPAAADMPISAGPNHRGGEPAARSDVASAPKTIPATAQQSPQAEGPPDSPVIADRAPSPQASLAGISPLASVPATGVTDDGVVPDGGGTAVSAGADRWTAAVVPARPQPQAPVPAAAMPRRMATEGPPRSPVATAGMITPPAESLLPVAAQADRPRPAPVAPAPAPDAVAAPAATPPTIAAPRTVATPPTTAAPPSVAAPPTIATPPTAATAPAVTAFAPTPHPETESRAPAPGARAAAESPPDPPSTPPHTRAGPPAIDPHLAPAQPRGAAAWQPPPSVPAPAAPAAAIPRHPGADDPAAAPPPVALVATDAARSRDRPVARQAAPVFAIADGLAPEPMVAAPAQPARPDLPAFAPLAVPTSGALDAPDLPARVTRQLATTVVATGNGTAELALAPEELGQVRMSIRQDDGVTLIHIIADRPETADLMRRHADLLLRDLSDSGLGTARLSFGDGGGQNGRSPQRQDGTGAPPTGTPPTGAPPEPPQVGEPRHRPAPGRSLDLRL